MLVEHKNSRPRSAADSGRLASQGLGSRYASNQMQTLDEKTVTSIWNGLGQYIAKQLRNGKGVSIPKFGNFTFSAVSVDLAGTTNPQQRDTQIRTPVYLVGKDFVSAVNLRTGVAHNNGAQLRPYDIKGSSGIIPKVKINYTEVAYYCSQSKDVCRNGCEQVFRFLSDKVRRGEPVQMDIPFVGMFIVRQGIAAVSFKDQLCEETRGMTAKNHFVNKLFANSNNRLNMQIFDENRNKLNPSFGMGGAMRLTEDAENWMQKNLNISVQELASINGGERGQDERYKRLQSAKQNSSQMMLRRYGSMKPEDLKRKSWNIHQEGGLTEHNKAMFDRQSEYSHGSVAKRPMSAVTRGSRMTNVPDVGRMKLMMIANDIYRNRVAISDILSQSKTSLRNVMSSSEIQQILKKTGIFIEIGNVKALLRELNFNWNGPSCSFFELLANIKIFLFGQSQEEERTQNYYQSLISPKHLQQEGFQFDGQQQQQYDINKKADTVERLQPQQTLQLVKDLFYASRRSLFDLFNEGRLGNNVDVEGLIKICQVVGGMQVNEHDIAALFDYVSRGRDSISFQEFEKIFQWQLPAGGDWETKAIRRIRDWMIKANYSSETAFEEFLKSTGKILQKKLTRIDFHKALSNVKGLGHFSAPEIDALFTMLDLKQDQELDVEEWKTRIYEDSQNPLQMLREVVNSNRLTPDDLIFKMHLRYWDPPLDFPKFCEALRRLDPSLGEIQLRYLAKSLKNRDNKVEITTLLRNLCGAEHETIDYRNKMFREIYAEINPHKIDELQQLLEDADPLNDGRVEPQGLKQALNKVVRRIDEESIDRFIRFLEKDKQGKINYMQFLGRMSEVSNRDHNPFKSVVQRLAYFIEQNGQTVHSLLKRLALKKLQSSQQYQQQQNIENSNDMVSVDGFAQFLKTKIDKKRDINTLRSFAFYMDIDKDGHISEIDLTTCLQNLNSEAFFKNSGEALARSAFSSAKKFYPNQKTALSEERANEIAKQIRTALINKKVAYKEAFNRFDANKDGFLSFAEFSQGIDQVLTISQPIKEKIFALMDKNEIGLVDYPKFLEVIQMSGAYKPQKGGLEDNFDWENNIIDQLKQWIWTSKITVDEAFKSFDRDFDGNVNKDDLRWGLINILNVKEDQILPTKLDRLFKLIDFYKTNSIQLSDFQRLVNNENPYSASQGSRATNSASNFLKSFGGGFVNASTFDWKVSAIQQIGLILSKKFSSPKESFEVASQHLQKVSFEQFKKFIDEENALKGFNMTGNLIQKIFSEMDPHKKGYLTEKDWCNAFQAFNWNEQSLIELKNLIQCSFSDCESAFEFFLTFKQQGDGKKVIGFYDFEKAIISLAASRFKRNEIQILWKYLTDNGKLSTLDKYNFRSHFDNLQYQGNSSVRPLRSAPPGARTTIFTQSSSSSQWQNDVFEKLRQIIKTSSKSFEEIFREFDEDKNGTISSVEFRNALRKLNLGLSSREIDQLMKRIDTNADGKIDWREFISKFKTTDLDERLKERAKDKMARIKELMILHMSSPNDAFRFFDESKHGKLTYQEFSKLAIKLNELAGERPPAYPVIKDLFDTIDIRKDGVIDVNEWQQTFGNVVEGNNQLSIKATPLTQWENSREFQRIGASIARNRKTLKERFEKIAGGGKLVTYFEARKAMDDMINQHFQGMSEEKLRCVLRVSEAQGSTAANNEPLYDFMKLLDIYKSRHTGPHL